MVAIGGTTGSTGSSRGDDDVMKVAKHQSLAQEIVDRLELETEPVALTYVDEAPAGVEMLSGEFPSSCSLWRRAEQGTFYAPAEKHFNCAVGARVMGFELPDMVRESLAGVVRMMSEAGYIGADEPERMPAVGDHHRGVVYGPLRTLPLPADLVLLWLTPRQAMLFNEAAGDVPWSSGTHMAALGRPACAALPIARSESKPTISFGCLGMRTFTEISNDRLLAVVPGQELEGFVDRLRGTVAANDTMAAVYGSMKAQFKGSQ